MYRAFFALPLMQNKNGDYTNSIYGFFSMLFSAIDKINPTHIVVAFDKKGKVFRHEKYDQYKAGRKPMPGELIFQFPMLKSTLDTIGINHMEYEGYEADDILGSFARLCDNNKDDIYILTGDRDAFQLISDNTRVFLTKKGVSDNLIVDEKMLYEMYSLSPNQMKDMKGLMGDNSDNIPGVKGVGEKTSIKLLTQYQTLENVYEHIDEIKGALQKKLILDKDNAFLSKEIGEIFVDLDVAKNLDDFTMPEFNENNLKPAFEALDFKNFLKRFGIETGVKAKSVDIKVIDNEEKLSALMLKLQKQDCFAIDFSDTTNISFDLDIEYEIVCEHSLLNDGFSPDMILGELKAVLECETISKIVFDAKSVKHKLYDYGIEINNIVFDTKLASYVLDPTKKGFELEDIANEYGLSGKSSVIFNAYDLQKKQIEKDELNFIYYDIEFPLTQVLYDMEQIGFKVDIDILNQLKGDFQEKITLLIEEIYSLCGYSDFNINSPKQLGEVLFERLNLPVQKKTKTGYSTNIEVLEKLEPHHPAIKKIIEYRKITKLKSTYIDGLLSLVDSNGKIHSTFNQISTATGRISSIEPNLQNIPIRTVEGREIRKVFVPSSEDRILIAADYSQIELRVLAEIADDKNMQDAFIKNQDIHKRTASQVFDTPIEEVTSSMRSDAKAVNFGIVYGISGFGLAKNIHISVNRASAYIEKYLEEFDGIAKYMEDIKEKAKKDGYVRTMFGRIRYIRELSSSNFNIRSFGERAAMNTPIQGTAADIIKIAMIKVNKLLKDQNLESRLILQVHDELIIDTLKSEEAVVKKLLVDTMQTVIDSKVPLVANVSCGDSWYEAK